MFRMGMSQGTHDTHIQVGVTSELKEDTRVEAAKNGQSMAEYVRTLLRENTGESDE